MGCQWVNACVYLLRCNSLCHRHSIPISKQSNNNEKSLPFQRRNHKRKPNPKKCQKWWIFWTQCLNFYWCFSPLWWAAAIKRGSLDKGKLPMRMNSGSDPRQRVSSQIIPTFRTWIQNCTIEPREKFGLQKWKNLNSRYSHPSANNAVKNQLFN